MATARYAAGTDVPTDRSRAEIEKVLRAYGATKYAYAWDDNNAVIGFVMYDRQIRFTIPLPDPGAREFTHTPTGKRRAPSAARSEHDAAVRRIWRVFLLLVKAKLDSVVSGVAAFDSEFLAHLVLPGGATVADVVGDRIDEAYRTGRIPELVPDYRRAIEAAHP